MHDTSDLQWRALASRAPRLAAIAGPFALACVVLVALAATCNAQEAGAERWRVEIGAAHGLSGSGNGDHGDDYYAVGSVEYLLSSSDRWRFGWRSYPLFAFRQHAVDGASRDEMIYAVATGLALRFHPGGRPRGFYAEAGTAALWHSRSFAGNGSRVNFLSEGGIGYAFANSWHLAVKYQHISNGGLRRPNGGIDAIGLFAGYSF